MANQDINGQWIHTTGGISDVITPTITVSTTPAYSSGDCVGGKIEIQNAVRAGIQTCYLQSIHLLDRANQKPALEIIFFDSNPQAATLTDNAAYASSTDDLKILARISVLATDWTTLNSKATATIKGIGALMKVASGTSLYAALVLNASTPTFVATTDFQVRFGILQD